MRCRMLLGAAFALLIARVGNAALLASEHSPATTIGQKDTAAEQASDAEKKSSDAEDVDKYQMLHEGLASSKHLRYPDAYLEGLLQQQELMEKRASMRGFQGMRGKKSAGDYYYNEPAYYAYGPAGPPDYYYDKRAPMGFQGMRGKKSSYEGDEGTGKRAPMGFQGMRGKKSLEEVLDELEKRAMMGFQGMRGKKSETDYEDEAAAAGLANQIAPAMSEGQWQKRAPMGFQGMRGRKSSGFLEELDELDKRAILGFHGMRGKKDMGYEREELDAAAINGYGQKRPMMMGFHGMRGKRSAGLYGLSLAGLEKRSPYRFFGTRGKKNPRWEMRGKFVGVRGKKWTAGPPRPLGPAIYDEDELQALYAASILGRTAAGLAATRH